MWGAALEAVAARRPNRCQAPQNGTGEKRLSISTMFAAPLPFELPAIMWLSPVELGLDTM
jgi:hypothetical protein